MFQIININMGEMAVGRNGIHIKTGGIGSCIVVVLYDNVAKVGGMAHAMLPKRKKKPANAAVNGWNLVNTDETAAKYADESVDVLIREIGKIGGRKERLKAKLVGGAKMFKVLSGDDYGIGYQNIEAAKKRLQEVGIPVESEETGGTVGRIAELDLENGLVDVSTKM